MPLASLAVFLAFSLISSRGLSSSTHLTKSSPRPTFLPMLVQYSLPSLDILETADLPESLK